ncbi:MAG: thioredoxin domain-containing protein [Fuerstiella sp.]|nr:thioredoxin domain-containing protein [Fuerstiella sp.]MCP4855505.1 thioredoxin domain-containing protein [Fuerstiella sp.]
MLRTRFANVLRWSAVWLYCTVVSTTLQADERPEQAAVAGKATVPAEHAGPANRLSKESSPYLLLHAHNPVDWYSWGPEAFEKAKKEGKPIFLSVGYSSCYWCHVMERKVFSDRTIAAWMNEHFVNIKVDREERPDVDDIYMTSLLVYQQMVGSPGGGGWPLSMFLTPEGNPIAGATYLPPHDSPDRGPGFLTVARRIDDLWHQRKSDLERMASLIANQVQRMGQPGVPLKPVNLAAELLNGAIDRIREMYDPVWGGVDFDVKRPANPRFPNVPRLELVLDLHESTDDGELLKIVEHSLTRMAQGGIHDHLGGGFHRYSTDRRWHVPHFEKMLYDQAMMLSIYTRTASITNSEVYRNVAVGIADFIHHEMTTPEGAFCSALDAETNAIEGEYYVWTAEEITSVLGEAGADVFSEVYGVKEPNPFEHGIVLHLPKSVDDAINERQLETTQTRGRLASMRSRLLKARWERERPLLDDKVLTAWNALMIKSLAVSGRELNRPQDTAAAGKAADFLLTHLRDADGHLLRTWRNGVARYPAYLDDYAFLVSALLELHRTTQSERWLTEARQLAQLQNELFYDDKLRAFYFTAKNHEKLIARTSSAYDSVFPSANSVTIRNLLELDALRESPELVRLARDTLNQFAPTLQKAPGSCSGLARALHLWLSKPDRLATVRSTDAPIAVTVQRQKHSKPSWQLTSLPEATVDTSDTQRAPKEHATFRPVIPASTPGAGLAPPNKPKPLKVKIYPLFNKIPRKGKTYVAIELQVKFGWHINANPSSPDFLIPTELLLKSKQKIKLTRVKYPGHHELKVEGSDEPYHVYDGKVLLYGLLEIDENETPQDAELEFHVKFQGCNENECLPPDLIVMKGKLPFAATGETLKKMNLEKWPKPAAKDKSNAKAAEKPRGT